jgi:Uma2 family endonuclease
MGLPRHKMTADEYLAWEEVQPAKNEFVSGEVYAMVGARRVHGRVTLNLGAALMHALSGTPCQAFTENMKVQVAHDTIVYPDVFVTCDPEDLRTDMLFKSPLLVIEVLSPSTQGYDRSLKFALYRRLPSLCEYALIDPDTRRAEVFRKGADGLFVLHDMSDGDSLVLDSIACTLPMAAVFAGLSPEDPLSP